MLRYAASAAGRSYAIWNAGSSLLSAPGAVSGPGLRAAAGKCHAALGERVALGVRWASDTPRSGGFGIWEMCAAPFRCLHDALAPAPDPRAWESGTYVHTHHADGGVALAVFRRSWFDLEPPNMLLWD